MKTDQPDRETILKLARERIFRFATSRVGREAADDIAQAAVITLNEKYSEKESADEIVKIAIGIAKRLLLAHYRTGKVGVVAFDSVTVVDEKPDPERQARFLEFQSRIMGAIEKLGGRCRELFLLKLDGYTFEEIKEKLGGGSIATVYVWDFRCKRDLNKLLEKGGAAL